MHQIQSADQLYEEAQRRAIETGFTTVDEYVADVVQDLESSDEIHDHAFTPEVIRELDRISAAAKTGGKTYGADEVKKHFHTRSEAWRADQTTR